MYNKRKKLISVLLVFEILLINYSSFAKEADNTKETVNNYIIKYNTDSVINNISESKNHTEAQSSETIKSQNNTEIEKIFESNLESVSEFKVLDELITEEKGEVTQLISLKSVDEDSALQQLNNIPGVIYAEPNYKIHADEHDPEYIKQWAVNNSSNYGINIDKAREISYNSNDITIAVLDTGIDINHPDLCNNIYTNISENVNNTDDDLNGYIDDIHGWDFTSYVNSDNNGDNTVYDGQIINGENEDTHGTHIAGIIAAGLNNNIGVEGVASNVKILPVKILKGRDGTVFSAIKGIEYAEAMGAKIVNCSWSTNNYSQFLYDCINNSDMLFVCAAGNESMNTAQLPSYPASYDAKNIISVAAHDSQGTLADFSNFGDDVDISAPGVDIYSTLPENTYGNLSGTSMASPFVAGSAALLLNVSPNLTSSQLCNRIKQTAKQHDNLKNKVNTEGLLDTSALVMSAFYPLDLNEERYGAESIVINGELYIIGGYANSTYASNIKKYNTLLKQWQYITDIPLPIVKPIIAHRNNKIYIIGGKGNNSISDVMQIYDINENSWEQANTAMPIGAYASGYACINDMVYIFGGITDNGYSNMTYEYNLSNDTWTKKQNLPYKCAYGSAIAVDNNIYLIGGCNENGCIKDIYLYDPSKNTFDKKTDMISGRKDFCTFNLGRDIYIYGGSNSFSQTGEITLLNNPENEIYFDSLLTTVEKYNISNNTCAKTDSGALLRCGASAVDYCDDIYIIGGWNGAYSNSVLRYFKTAIPKNIRFKTSDNKLNIKWNEIVGAESYNIEINDVVYNTDSAFYVINASDNVEYKVRVQAVNETETSFWSEYEYHYTNSTMLDAKNITVNSIISDNLYKPEQARWYKINNDNSGSITISLENIPDGCIYQLQLCNSNGDVIANSVEENGIQAIKDFVLSPYAYYIKITLIYGTDTENPYTLKCNFQKADNGSVSERIKNAFLKPSALDDNDETNLSKKDISKYDGDEDVPTEKTIEDKESIAFSASSMVTNYYDEHANDDDHNNEITSNAVSLSDYQNIYEESTGNLGSKGSETSKSVVIPKRPLGKDLRCRVVIEIIPECEYDVMRPEWDSNNGAKNLWQHYSESDGKTVYYLSVNFDTVEYELKYTYKIKYIYKASGSTGDYTIKTFIMYGSGEDYNSVEHSNDTPRHASGVVTNDGYNSKVNVGKIDHPYDRDCYKINVSQSRDCFIYLKSPPGKQYSVSVYDNTCDTDEFTSSQYMNGWHDEDGSYASIYGYGNGKNYCIIVRSEDGSYSNSEEYTLTVFYYLDSKLDDMISNDTFGGADSNAVPVKGMLGGPAKAAEKIKFSVVYPMHVRMYPVDLKAGDKLSINMDLRQITNYNDAKDKYRIEIYSDVVTTGNKTQYKSRSYNNPGNTKSKFTTFIAEKDGRYYVAVKSLTGHYHYSNYGYLTVTHTPKAYLDIYENKGNECSNDFVFTTIFSIGGYEFGVSGLSDLTEYVSGTIDNELDVDWYRYKTGKGNQVKALNLITSTVNMKNQANIIVLDNNYNILYNGNASRAYEFKANTEYYIGVYLSDNSFNLVKDNTNYTLSVSTNTVSDLKLMKGIGANTLYVNNPEHLINNDIIRDREDGVTNSLIYHQENVSGKNHLYVTQAVMGENRPTKNFYYDVDFYNPHDEDITMVITEPYYGCEYLWSGYMNLPEVYKQRLLDLHPKRTVTLTHGDHKLLFKDILNTMFEVKHIGKETAYIAIFADFEIQGEQSIEVNTLAAYEKQYLDLLTFGGKTYSNYNENMRMTYNMEINDAKMIYNGRIEDDVYKKFKGIEYGASDTVRGVLSYVIDDETADGDLKVRLIDSYYGNNIYNPNSSWISCINPFADRYDGRFLCMPSSLHRYIYNDTDNDKTGKWYFDFEHLNPPKEQGDNNSLYADSLTADELNPKVNSSTVQYFKDRVKAGKENAYDNVIPSAIGLTYEKWEERTAALGDWGITYEYRITVQNLGNLDRIIRYTVKVGDFAAIQYKLYNWDNNTVEKFETETITEKPAGDRTQKTIDFDIAGNTNYTIQIKVLGGVGPAGYQNYLKLLTK